MPFWYLSNPNRVGAVLQVALYNEELMDALVGEVRWMQGGMSSQKIFLNAQKIHQEVFKILYDFMFLSIIVR